MYKGGRAQGVHPRRRLGADPDRRADRHHDGLRHRGQGRLDARLRRRSSSWTTPPAWCARSRAWPSSSTTSRAASARPAARGPTGWSCCSKRIEHGEGRPGDPQLLLSICKNIGGNSLCALGDAAIGPVRSLVRPSGAEIDHHHPQDGRRAAAPSPTAATSRTEPDDPCPPSPSTTAPSRSPGRHQRDRGRPEGRRADPPLLLPPAPLGGRPVPHVPGQDRRACRSCRPAARRQVMKDGMVVRTDTPEVTEAQQGMMEFLLINHPLDCPICDQAGECGLQDYSFKHGVAFSRFQFEDKRTYPGRERIPLGANVLLNMNRCIQCTRCVRFTQEIAGTGELGFFNRGARTEIGTFPGKRARQPARHLRRRHLPGGRPDLDPLPLRRARLLPRQEAVALHRLRGRLQHHDRAPARATSSATSRASTPRSTTTGCATTAAPRFERYQDAAAARPRRAARLGRLPAPAAGLVLALEGRRSDAVADAPASRDPESRQGAIAVPRLGLPHLRGGVSLRAAGRLAGATPHRSVAGRQGPRADDPQPPGRHHRAGGRRPTGAAPSSPAWLPPRRHARASRADGPADRRRRGALRGAGRLRQRLRRRAPTIRRPSRGCAGRGCLIVFGWADSPLAQAADVALPVAHHAEKDGTFVNVEWRLQRFARAFPPPGQARAGGRGAGRAPRAASTPGWAKLDRGRRSSTAWPPTCRPSPASPGDQPAGRPASTLDGPAARRPRRWPHPTVEAGELGDLSRDADRGER